MTRFTNPGAGSAQPALHNFMNRFNATLAEELDTVEASVQVVIDRRDYLGITDAVIAKPWNFGLTNATDAACPECGGGVPAPGAADTVVSNPDEYLHWDDYQYSATVQQIVGNAAADLVPGQ